MQSDLYVINTYRFLESLATAMSNKQRGLVARV